MKLAIRELWKSQGMTLEHLAAMIGVTHGYLSEIGRGVKTVNTRRLNAIEKALGVEPAFCWTHQGRLA